MSGPNWSARDGYFGFAAVNWDKPFDAWSFHPISEQFAAVRFGHGLGIGDVNGDGAARRDSPRKAGSSSQRRKRERPAGGASSGVVQQRIRRGRDVRVRCRWRRVTTTSSPARRRTTFGPELVRAGTRRVTKRRSNIISLLSSHLSENAYGVLFSELHSVRWPISTATA